MKAPRRIDLVFSGVILSLILMVVAFAASHPRKPAAPTDSRDPRGIQGAVLLMRDLYPGRQFRIIWSHDLNGWRTGFAIPLEEPRFGPISISCPTGLNMGTAPCHLIH